MPPTKSKNIAGNTDSCTNKKNKFAQAEKSQVSKPEVVICDACPILCRIRKNQTGACERYGNVDGLLTRLDPMLVMRKVIKKSGGFVKFSDAPDWDGSVLRSEDTFVTGIGAGTTYPDYKPAPFIVSSSLNGVDMITVVSEGIFSYCGIKAKIDTDRFIGPETSAVRCAGEKIGHVTTAEYGSQMLALGGVHHLTGTTKREGAVTCQVMLDLCNGEAVKMSVDDGAELTLQAGAAPIINGISEERMRVGCGSAAIGMFAQQCFGHTDEVIVIDDHITGVLSEHQAGRLLGLEPSGIKVRGRRSTPGRYFNVAEPGSGWGGTDITNPLTIIEKIDKEKAYPGLRILMVSTTGEDYAYFVLNKSLLPEPADLPKGLAQLVQRLLENCEKASTSILFMAGAGGSLRAGVTQNPVLLTQSSHKGLTRITCGGAPVYLWPGGGITIMVDVTKIPANGFGYVPTPAIVAPIEFTMTYDEFIRLGGFSGNISRVEDIESENLRQEAWFSENAWPFE